MPLATLALIAGIILVAGSGSHWFPGQEAVGVALLAVAAVIYVLAFVILALAARTTKTVRRSFDRF